MFLVLTVGFLINISAFLQGYNYHTPCFYVQHKQDVGMVGGNSATHCTRKKWYSPVFTEAKQAAVIKVNTWNDWF